MIVKMSKVYIASAGNQKDRLLEALRDLGVVHLVPVDPQAASADEKTVAQMDTLGRAIQILSAHQPTETNKPADMAATDAAAETLNIHRIAAERHNRLNTLHRQIEHQAVWGDVKLDDLESLRRAGLDVGFYTVPTEQAGDIDAELVQPISTLADKRILVAVISRGDDEISLPDSAEPLEPPDRDRPTLRAEAERIDTELKTDAKRLDELARLLQAMQAEHQAAHARAEYSIAMRGALHDGQLFAVQGWAPVEHVDSLAGLLAEADVHAAVRQLEPAEDEDPPTLVRYPRWASPIKALFDILGTTPGYREYELSPFFMVAMPIFTAMLVGDAGYGLIFTLIGLLFYGKIKSVASKPAAQLVLVFGVVTMAWGLLSGNCFGASPELLIAAGGWRASLGHAAAAAAVLWDADPEISRNIIIKISFVFGCIHLVLAHLRQAIGLAPNVKSLSEVGWCVFLVGMLGLIWALFFKDNLLMPWGPIGVLLGLGGAMVLLFSYPNKNIVKMLGLGLIANIMPAISTFSDTMSYIRLMAVGLASYYIASAFNGLAWQVGEISPPLIAAAVLILLAAHALNIILCLIAIFAHGVRLNMLEFSNNAGVQWVGTPYAPFATTGNEGER